jgi:hypothetical protein
VCHRDDDVRAAAGAFTFEEPCDNLERSRQAAGGQVGDLRGRHRRRRVREHPGPAEVVDVVTRAQLVAIPGAEARHGTEDRGWRDDQSEASHHARAKAVQDDVGAGAQAVRQGEPRLRLEVADD